MSRDTHPGLADPCTIRPVAYTRSQPASRARARVRDKVRIKVGVRGSLHLLLPSERVGQVFFGDGRPRMGDITDFLVTTKAPPECRAQPTWENG